MEKENMQKLSEETLENVTGGVGLIAEEGQSFEDRSRMWKGVPEEIKKGPVTAIFQTETVIQDQADVWPPW